MNPSSQTLCLADMTFEEALAELETLVRQLEEGNLQLEEAIKAYERGSELKKHCEEKLRAAKLKVDQIMIDQTTGTMTSKSFESA